VISHEAITGLVSLESRMLILLDMAHLVISFDLGVEIEPLLALATPDAALLSLPY
jgi:hypothetical protein